MSGNSSVIHYAAPALSARHGVGWGFVGIVAFSLTLPMTRLTAGAGFDPVFVGCGRAVVAAVLAGLALIATRTHLPTRGQCARLLVVAGGVVLGFPLLTAYALTSVPASHGAVVIGLLPAATAAMAVLRGREKVSASFWAFAGLGAVAVVAFASVHNSGVGALRWEDLLLIGAVLAAAIGYAEGGLLARELGSWQTVSWALVLAAPFMSAMTAASLAQGAPSGSVGQWLAFGYLSVVSMYLGFFAWYRGLAIGPMAHVSQIQLIQPVLTIGWAALLLGEHVGLATGAGAVVVIACAGRAVRVRTSPVGQAAAGPGPR